LETCSHGWFQPVFTTTWQNRSGKGKKPTGKPRRALSPLDLVSTRSRVLIRILWWS